MMRRIVKTATRRAYKIKTLYGIEKVYRTIDWQRAKSQFNSEYPDEKDYKICVEVNRGCINHYRLLKSFESTVPSFDEVMTSTDKAQIQTAFV